MSAIHRILGVALAFSAGALGCTSLLGLDEFQDQSPDGGTGEAGSDGAAAGGASGSSGTGGVGGTSGSGGADGSAGSGGSSGTGGSGTGGSSGTDGGASCTGVTCDTQPVATCANSTTRRSYAATGTCQAGKCTYPHTDTPCTSPTPTCDTGVCVGFASATSCQTSGDGRTNCGPSGNASCCESLPVPGGTFSRGYDAVYYKDPSYTATVSDFRLDEYEVTVGRFRQFVAATDGGWRPDPGSGKHLHLNGGSGLADGAGYEGGWDSSWDSRLPPSSGDWDIALSCAGTPLPLSWTSTPGANELKPIQCATWYEAYAFCIWDGGFLPSEAEWDYAAAAGAEQRVYPWSSPPTDTSLDCTYANFSMNWPGTSCNSAVNEVGLESPLGDGRWGQHDLAGNVAEWTLDRDGTYPMPCNDCAAVNTAASNRMWLGGGFMNNAGNLQTANRASAAPDSRIAAVGIRCARSP